MDRERFLAQVRESLGDVASERTGVRFHAPAPPSREEMAVRLAQELEAVGGVAHPAASPAEARERILEILAQAGARRVITSDTPLLRRLDLDLELRGAGLEVTAAGLGGEVTREGLRLAAFAADAGVTSVDFGVAETGTLAILAGPGQGRAISLLPPIHVAVLDARDVVWELAALFEEVAARGVMPSALTFITGPSRTGDIEQTLTIGVHGPGALHLVLIDGCQQLEPSATDSNRPAQSRRIAPVLRSNKKTLSPRITRDATLRQLPGR